MKTIEHKGVDYYVTSHINGYTVSWLAKGYREHVMIDSYDGVLSFIDSK